jgi:hypothetical protein
MSQVKAPASPALATDDVAFDIGHKMNLKRDI